MLFSNDLFLSFMCPVDFWTSDMKVVLEHTPEDKEQIKYEDIILSGVIL